MGKRLNVRHPKITLAIVLRLCNTLIMNTTNQDTRTVEELKQALSIATDRFNWWVKELVSTRTGRELALAQIADWTKHIDYLSTRIVDIELS